MSKLATAVFLGSKKLGLSVFKSLYGHSRNLKWTIIHPEDSSDARSNLADFQDFARLSGLDLLVSSSAGTTKAMLLDIRPDIGFACGWYWLLDPEALSCVPHGVWGIHNSLLPKYRGGSPLVWSIINGDPLVGISIFQISEGMDDGKILHQVKVQNNTEDDVGTILAKIEARLIEELPGKWGQLITGNAVFSVQDESEATYCGQRAEEDGLIDWTGTAPDIHNFVRAQTRPYPCAFTYLFEDRVHILKTAVFDRTYYGTPGQVLKRNQDSVLVSCGKGSALEILKVSVRGEEILPARYLRSIKFRFSNRPILPA